MNTTAHTDLTRHQRFHTLLLLRKRRSHDLIIKAFLKLLRGILKHSVKSVIGIYDLRLRLHLRDHHAALRHACQSGKLFLVHLKAALCYLI